MSASLARCRKLNIRARATSAAGSNHHARVATRAGSRRLARCKTGAAGVVASAAAAPRAEEKGARCPMPGQPASARYRRERRGPWKRS